MSPSDETDLRGMRRALFTLSLLFVLVLTLFILTYLQQRSFDGDQQLQDRAIAQTQRALISGNTSKLQRDVELIRRLNYKVCVRINDTRGVTLIRLHQIKTPGARILASDLPMYSCDPSFADGATRLSPRQTAAYLRLLAKGKTAGP